MPGSSRYLRGSQSDYSPPQKTLMLNDYSLCVTRTQHLTVLQVLTHGFLCVKNNMLHCIFKSPFEYTDGLTDDAFWPRTNSSYCGSAWIQGIPISSVREYIYVEVTRTHNIHISILQLSFFLSYPLRCHQHGIVFSSAQFQSEHFCGTRVAWNFVTQSNILIIHLVLQEYKSYSLQLFYSSFHTNWMADISSVFKTYNDNYLSFDIIKSYYPAYTISNDFYLMAHPENYIVISMILHDTFVGHLRIHDGPGPLSLLLLEVKESQTAVSRRVQTSTYWTFIRVQLLDLNINSSLSLQLTTAFNMRRNIICTNRNKGVVVAASSKWKNTACMDNIYIRRDAGYITLNVETFLFSGPSMVTDLSESVCQYGGLFVQFNGKMSQYAFCTPVHRYIIYTGTNSLTFILVWFSGYSHGNFRASIKSSFCKSYYPELRQPHDTNLLKFSCLMFVCPTLQRRNQPDYRIELGYQKHLGASSISIKHVHSLSTCEPKYSKRIHADKLKIKIKTIFFDNWPLNVRSNVSYSTHNIRSKVNIVVDYLHSAIIQFPHICTTKMTRVQMAVVLRHSICFKRDQTVLQLVVNKVPDLTNLCVGQLYQFTPSGKGPNNYLNFLHKDTGEINSGHRINVNYVKCPIECRHYRYRAFVKSEDDKVVFVYTANVGHTISTGKHHRGFRISIITPDPLCGQHMTCVLRLSTLNLDVRTEERNSVRHSTLHFYGKR